MKLSDYSSYENLTDEDINSIVYGGIEDDGCNCTYGIVFGNSDKRILEARVKAACMAYNNGRIKKVIFCGGNNGVSNVDNDPIPEAVKMSDLATNAEELKKLGDEPSLSPIPEQDIILDNESRDTLENVDNAFQKIQENDQESLEKDARVALITSDYHLKRCMATIKQKYPNINVTMISAKDGFTDCDNWDKSDGSKDSGREIATTEASIITEFARDGKIYDLELSSAKSL